jgi:hypothetical protein
MIKKEKRIYIKGNKKVKAEKYRKYKNKKRIFEKLRQTKMGKLIK